MLFVKRISLSRAAILALGPALGATATARAEPGSSGQIYVTKAEFGACGSAGHCTKRTIDPPKMPTWNC